jgi:hypothetical protein
MKTLVIGGTSGLGRALSVHYGADAVGRSTGHSVPENTQSLIDLSINYDCVINCIPDNNQNAVLFPMYEHHDRLNKSTYFITVGSMSWRLHDSDHSKRQLFDWNEQQILRKTQLRHTLVNPAWLWHSPDTAEITKVQQEEMFKLFDFLLSLPYNSVIHLIEIKGTHNVAR